MNGSKADDASRSPPIVYVIDDDPDVRDGLKSLVESVGLESQCFGSPEQFMRDRRDTASCLVLDVRLPGTSGLDFQLKLADAGIDIPIIFITGNGDMRMSVSAMKAGAVHFLTKPFREQELLDAVQEALHRDRSRRARLAQSQLIRSRYESLTPREREILPLVVAGLQHKQIAYEMKLSEVTTKVHRASLMRKFKVRTLADLVKVAVGLGLATAAPHGPQWNGNLRLVAVSIGIAIIVGDTLWRRHRTRSSIETGTGAAPQQGFERI